MKMDLLFPSKYIRAVDLQGKDVTLTITGVRLDKMEQVDGSKKTKGVVNFEQTEKMLVLNRTLAESIKLATGSDETADWVGRRITLYPQTMKDPFGDGEIQAIRMRGTPDMTRPLSATIQRGRKTIKISLVPTGPKQTKTKAAPAPAVGKAVTKPSLLTDVHEGESEADALAREAAEYEAQQVAEGNGAL